MNLQFYIEKLKASDEFKKFISENPDAYLCSGFFVIDKQGKDNKQHIDYYVESGKKMFSFQLEDGVKLVEVEMLESVVPVKMLLTYDIDFDEIEKIIIDKMTKEKIESKIQKMLLSLQRVKTRDFLITTVFIGGLGMIKVNIDVKDKKITDFAKKSFMDMVKVVKKDKK